MIDNTNQMRDEANFMYECAYAILQETLNLHSSPKYLDEKLSYIESSCRYFRSIIERNKENGK